MKKRELKKKNELHNTKAAPRFSFILEAALAALFLVVVSFVYKGLFQTFFQQDEWIGYGAILGYQDHWATRDIQLLSAFAGNGRLISEPIQYILYTAKPFSVFLFAFFSICTHAANSYLVYRLVQLFVKSRYIALLSGLFFALLYTPHEALSWYAASTTTLPSAFFFLLALNVLIANWNKITTARLFIVQMFLIISYLFKESDFAFLIIIPLVVALAKAKEKKMRLSI